MDGRFGAEVEGGGLQESPKKCGAESVPAPLVGTGTADGCFDCNICLDFAVDPVVTLCGHLYCWPCMYKWLELESTTTPRQCPVCKTSLSRTALVPLYGRGQDSGNDTLNIPRRPSVSQHQATATTALNGSGTYPTLVQLQHQLGRHRRHHHQRPAHHDDYLHAAVTPLRGVHPIIGSVAVAVLPWVFGDHVGSGLHHSSPYHMFDGSSSSPGMQRRQELEAERSLHRISIFLFCFAILCLLLF